MINEPRLRPRLFTAMNHTEFWNNLEIVFGSAYGRALAGDLALPELDHMTATQALEANVNPQLVWESICREMDLGEEYHFVHRTKR